MKIFQKTLLIAAAALAFAACSEDFDSTVDPNVGGSEPEGEKVAMTFGLAVPDMVVSENAALPGTKAAADDSFSVSLGGAVTRTDGYDEDRANELKLESAVKDLWVIQFSADAPTATKQVCKHYSNIVDNKVSVDLYNNNGAKTPVYFVANAGADAFAAYETGKTGAQPLSLKQFKELSLNVPETGYAGDLATNGLPMLADTLLSAVTGEETIRLKRTVAKVELILKQENFDALTVSNVQICDAPKKFYYSDNATQLKALKANYSSGENGKGHFDNVFVTKSIADLKTGAQRIVFYIPENMRGEGTAGSPESKNWWNAPLHSSYIEIIGTHTDGSLTTDVEYCIFPGKDNTNDFNIERNNYYKITATIRGANFNGDGRVTVAGKAIDLNATNDNQTANCYIVEKTTQIYCFNASTMGNGVNVPACSTTQNSVTQDQQAIVAKTDMKPAKAAVLWEAGPSGHAKELISNVKVDTEENKVYFSTSGMLGGDRIPGNALIATYANATTTDVLWSWHIWFTQNDLDETGVTHKSSFGGGARIFKVMNRNLGADSNPEADAASYGLLYQWGRKDPFVGAGKLHSTAKEFAPSSKTDWDTDVVAAKAVPGATGATDGLKRIQYAVAHPTTFITYYVKDDAGAETYDWVGGNSWANQFDALWGNPNKVATIDATHANTAGYVKTMYDPCPVGWRMPAQDTWTNFTTTHGNTWTLSEFNVVTKTTAAFDASVGWVFYTGGTPATAYYPAAGYRHDASGALTNVSTYGYYWSSSSYAAGNINAGFLYFNSGYVSPLGSGGRAAGLSVRCVQE